MSYPAPDFLSDDPWFGSAPLSNKAKKAKVKRTYEAKAVEQATKEPQNIHEALYQAATKNVATTLSLNPAPSFIGGSEVFQQWASGQGR
jgi:hypothetical protein